MPGPYPTATEYRRYYDRIYSEAREQVAKMSEYLEKDEVIYWYRGQEKIIDAEQPIKQLRFAHESAFMRAVDDVFNEEAPEQPGELNLEQKHAVGAMSALGRGQTGVVRAGAGSGKTTVLVALASWMASNGPTLAVTFTTAAAREVLHRLGDDHDYKVRVQTLHAFCLDKLRRWRRQEVRNGSKAPHWKPLADSETAALLRAMAHRAMGGDVDPAMSTLDLDVAQLTTDEADLVLGQKRRGDAAAQCVNIVSALWNEVSEAHSPATPAHHAIAEKLEVVALKNHRLPFGLMLREFEREWLAHPGDRYDYTVIDEAQDLSPVQCRIVKLVAGGPLVFVGDPRQSIYGFQGAASGIFDSLWVGADACAELVRNHRSCPELVEYTSALSTGHLGYPAQEAVREPGGKIVYRSRAMGGPREEARALADYIGGLVGNGRSPSDVAVLVRFRADATILAQELDRKNIRFRTHGGAGGMTPLRDHRAAQELRKLVGVLLVEDDRAEALDGVQCITGVGPQMAKEVVHHSSPLMSAHQLTTAAHTRIDALLNTIRSVMPSSGDDYADDVLRRVIPECNKAVRELSNRLVASGDGVTIREWYQSFGVGALESEGDEDAVTVSTVHSSKGLEWPVVILSSISGSRYPSYRCDNDSEYDEEDRLWYVGATRARDVLVLSDTLVNIFGPDNNAPPGPCKFMEELRHG